MKKFNWFKAITSVARGCECVVWNADLMKRIVMCEDNWVGRDNLKRIWFHWHYPIKNFNWLKAFTSVGGDCVDRNGQDITDHVQNKKKNGLVASRPWRKEKWTGCIQTMEKRKMDWLHPDHKEKKNGLASSRPWRKEIWTGFILTKEKRKMDWLYPDHRDLRNINSMRLAQSVVEVVLSEALSWWSELWCTKDYLICGDILKIENHSEYNHQIQWKQSNTCLLSDARRH